MSHLRTTRGVQRAFTLVELMTVVAIIGVLAAFAIPQYQTHVGRAQAARVMTEASALRKTIEACLAEGKTAVGTGSGECDPQAVGSRLLDAAQGPSQTSVPLPAGTGVPQIQAPLGATTKIVATFSRTAASLLAGVSGNTLTWERTAGGSWRCHTTVAPRYRPAGCGASS